MSVTRDVVLDLWPLYEAGELSADSRALVDRFLEGDQEFAAILRRAGAATRRALGEGRAAAGPEERRVVEATRRRIAGQRWLSAAATMASLVPLSIGFGDGAPYFLVSRHPAILLSLVVAAGLWIWLFRLSRSVK